MGSEGTSVVTVHVTGFKKFHGVSVNPTEVIVGKLKEFMHTKGLPNGLVLGSCNILETAGLGQLTELHKMLESAVAERNNQSPCQVIWLHLGVNSGATRFAIENQAVNEATFRCPDELGWKPHKVPIIPSDGGITRTRETSLPVKEISKTLSKMGYDVTTSDDAGRFVCNYVYYQSLQFAEQHGIKSLFVHVPLFFTINEETQMEFVGSLLEVKLGAPDLVSYIMGFLDSFGGISLNKTIKILSYTIGSQNLFVIAFKGMTFSLGCSSFGIDPRIVCSAVCTKSDPAHERKEF